MISPEVALILVVVFFLVVFHQQKKDFNVRLKSREEVFNRRLDAIVRDIGGLQMEISEIHEIVNPDPIDKLKELITPVQRWRKHAESLRGEAQSE